MRLINTSKRPLGRAGCQARARWGIPVGLAGALICAGVDATEYRLTPGDVVEIAVAGVPELRQRLPIQLDGSIAIPSLGTIRVGGLTASELPSRIQAAVQSKVVRQRFPDGREQVVMIQPGDVVATIAEYRPVYVTGDVLTPGQHVFRPMMTVRQAVAISGGYSLMRSRIQTANVDPADLQRDYASLWTDFVREQIRAARLKAELNDKDEFDERVSKGSPLPPSTVAELVKAEAESLRISQADWYKEVAFLQRATRQADEQIAVLTEQRQQEEHGARLDQEELDRVNKLLTAGSLTFQRVTESRRAVLLSSTRHLQTALGLMQVKRQREEYARQLDRNGTLRRVNLLRDLRDATARLSDLGVRLQAIGEKMRPIGASRSMLVPMDNGRPEVTIVRRDASDWKRVRTDEDAELEPGDVIEVAFRSEITVGAAAR